MKFRTEIEIPARHPLEIDHEGGVVMLGSCFTDNVGGLLERDGFDVLHNPMGPLYNPASIATAIRLAMDGGQGNMLLRDDDGGKTHCLNFASRYQAGSQEALLATLEQELSALRQRLLTASTVILTLGTAYVFEMDGEIVGNCHKFPAKAFTRRRLSVDECERHLRQAISLVPEDTRIIFTVSPIRHTADGLHGNGLSKATLQMAVDRLVDGERIHYFPAYEIMMDDLRDYRFYASDMTHPSEVAAEYIYDIFSQYYFTADTVSLSQLKRKESLRKAHRPIL